MVKWATVEQPALAVERIRPEVEAYIATHPEADRVRAEFAAADG
jgi:hypothetical protein